MPFLGPFFMNIRIESIPHEKQRYSTVGDWYYEDNGKTLVIRVSDLGDERYNQLVAVHELIEVLICQQTFVSQAAVDAFDMEFEKNRPEGNIDEPGDDPHAPYRTQHSFATAVERMLAAAMGVSWSKYADAVEALP